MITIYSAITFFYTIFIQSEYFQNGYEIVQLQFRKYYLKVNMALLLGEITLFLSKGVVWSRVRFKKLKLISAEVGMHFFHNAPSLFAMFNKTLCAIYESLLCYRIIREIEYYTNRIIDDRMENSIKGRRIGDNLR